MDRKNQTPQGKVRMVNSFCCSVSWSLCLNSYLLSSWLKIWLALKGQIAQVVVEFLEVAVSCIVFLKGFYPARKNSSVLCLSHIVNFAVCDFFRLTWIKHNTCLGAFERRRYMNVVVQKAVHPQLAGYIHSVTAGLLPFIQKVCFIPLVLRPPAMKHSLKVIVLFIMKSLQLLP
jgi:hypothetical protein